MTLEWCSGDSWSGWKITGELMMADAMLPWLGFNDIADGTRALPSIFGEVFEVWWRSDLPIEK